MRHSSASSPNRYRWGWPHAADADAVTLGGSSIAIFIVVYAAVVGVFALPWIARATGVTWRSAAILLLIHASWLVFSRVVLARHARTSRRAFDAQVVGNALLGTVLASAFPVLGDAPGTVLWGILILYATTNGALPEFEPSIALQAFHMGVPLATIPIFVVRGAGPWAVGGPVLAAILAAVGYHLAAALSADAHRHRRAAAEAERRASELRLARDLHDVVGSTLGTVKAYADVLASSAPDVATPLSSVAQGGLDDLRAVIDALAPPREAGLRGTLEAIARRLSRPTVEIDVAGDEPPAMPGAMRVAAARIVQEAVFNAIRHGGAARVAVAFQAERGTLRLEISDDGRGFDVESARAGDGRGLAAIQARASELGGDVAITSRPGATSIVARLLLARRQPA